ncbi:hypothetical protein [Actinokineospora globicatena]|uniref:Uncharacterized protein n=1 Tax=Actinokineospora globicatena TaxID=103729 RepID=A0A9W6QVQ0_9PSEU|nr:hypothetical protein [Actinokineospora globicatena]GLW95439.1 hypothetical protein Aglo03_62550 [Actinokineospora globicatena]
MSELQRLLGATSRLLCEYEAQAPKVVSVSVSPGWSLGAPVKVQIGGYDTDRVEVVAKWAQVLGTDIEVSEYPDHISVYVITSVADPGGNVGVCFYQQWAISDLVRLASWGLWKPTTQAGEPSWTPVPALVAPGPVLAALAADGAAAVGVGA